MSTATLPRPAERVAIVSMLLVFLCGVALGAVALSLWHHSSASAHSQASVNGLQISTKEWKTELNLTDDQMRQLNSVLDDFSRYYGNLLADGNTRIVQILTPDQRLKYERLKKTHQR